MKNDIKNNKRNHICLWHLTKNKMTIKSACAGIELGALCLISNAYPLSYFADLILMCTIIFVTIYICVSTINCQNLNAGSYLCAEVVV